MKQDRDRAFLGTGLAYPFQVNARGEIKLVDGEEDIRQSICIILGTHLGERVMRPEFGCRVHELIFEPRDATTSSLIKKYVEEALEIWEPRIEVIDVLASTDDAVDGGVYVEIEYLVKSTHDIRSIIYPFFLATEEEG